MMKLDKNLVKARKKSGLSQEEVAERLGVSCSLVQAWERGKCLPDIFQMEKLLKNYGITFEEILSKSTQEAMEKMVQNQPENVDWTKVWSTKYPVLAKYPQEVSIKEYEVALGHLLTKLQQEHGYSAQDAFLVLKDILGKIWQKKS